MNVTAGAIDEKYNLKNPNSGDDYTIDTTCAGCSNSVISVGGSVPSGLCTPAAIIVVCDPAETGDSAYRINLTNDSANTMQVQLSDEIATVTNLSFPGPVIVNADGLATHAAATVSNLTGTPLTFNGGSAADFYGMGTGVDTVHGGAAVDTVSYASGGCATVTLDGVANDTQNCGGAPSPFENISSDVENVTGGSGIDTITGNSGPNVLSGGGAKDVLHGAAGNDGLHADAGGALMTGGLGNDTFDGDPSGGGDVTYADRTGFAGILSASTNGIADDGDTFGGESDNLDSDITKIIGTPNGINLLNGSIGSLPVTLIGGDTTDTLTGSAFNDSLNGGNGGDDINGGLGDDTVIPGPGLDTYNGGGGTADRLDYSSDTGGINLRHQPQHRRYDQRRRRRPRERRRDIREPIRRDR